MCLTRRAVPDFFWDRLLRPGVFSMATRDWSSEVLDSSSFTYDAENKQVKVETLNESGNPIATVGEYHYDGDGKRVKKVVPLIGETTIFAYDASNRLVAEYSTVVEPATIAKTSYLTNDHLGSPRVLTDQLGHVISRRDFHPFGEEIATPQRTESLGYMNDTVRQKFTGYERDNETNLDYAKARYYVKNHGRFTTTDPLLASGKAITPQTWNRYSYVINNPLRFIDPNGQCTAPTGLKAGQVGICFEAFIAAKNIGPGGIGHGDNRSFAGNDKNLTARVTVWAIVSTDETTVSVAKSDKVESSVIGVYLTGPTGVGLPNTSGERTVALQGTATTDAKLSNINSKVGEKDFGAGVDVTVSIANGTNGGQQLGKDMEVNGAIMMGTSPTTAGQVAGAIVNGAGRVVEAVSPAGTIDGNMTIRITGNGQVQYVGGETRGFPSFALYTYTVGPDGAVQTNRVREIPEGTIDELTKPMKKVP